MEEDYKKKVRRLKAAILEYLGVNGRHYGDLSRQEQSVEDLAQALNTRLDQLLIRAESDPKDQEEQDESPRERLANRFMEAGARLSKGGKIDEETADQFEVSLDLLDLAADYKRAAGSAQDKAESAIIREKRNRGS